MFWIKNIRRKWLDAKNYSSGTRKVSCFISDHGQTTLVTGTLWSSARRFEAVGVKGTTDYARDMAAYAKGMIDRLNELNIPEQYDI